MLATQEYRTDWMKTGAAHTENKERINTIIDRMEWDTDFKGKEIAMMPAMGINALIKEFKIPRLSAVSYNCHELAPYGLYGIEGNYINAKVQIFFVDEGSQIVPICSRVWEIS